MDAQPLAVLKVSFPGIPKQIKAVSGAALAF
jgi:hypothetical protein